MVHIEGNGNRPDPVICVDFDGTLCDFAFPNIGDVKPGAKATLILFRQLGYKIIIWSCRTSYWNSETFGGGPAMERSRVKEMIKFLEENEIPYDIVDDGSKGKPSASFYIDDKGIRYDNNWAEIAAFVYNRTYTIKH